MDRLFALLRQYFPWLFTASPNRARIAFAVALASILGALGSQYLLGIPACELCYWQRWPYYVGLPILALVLVLWKRMPPMPRIWLTLVVALVFVVSVGLASYHAGIEYDLWPGPSSCTDLDTQFSFSDLDNISAAEQVVPCDVVPFAIFGISMAGFNALGSAFIAGLLFWSAFGQWRRWKGPAV
ncbi:MAG: disulfide bond formation protein B [Alphaproteobacteria bacterium]|nr:disulfide bond formation protein B [Alphaproteobacteria bacterium]